MNGQGIYYYSWNEYPYLKGEFSNNKPKGHVLIINLKKRILKHIGKKENV